MKWAVHIVAPRDQWLTFPGFGASQTGHQLSVEAETKEEAGKLGLEQSMYPGGTIESVKPIVRWRLRYKVPPLPTKKRPRAFRQERLKAKGLRGGMIQEYVVESEDEAMAKRQGSLRLRNDGLYFLEKYLVSAEVVA
jgi:hypothetical protein